MNALPVGLDDAVGVTLGSPCSTQRAKDRSIWKESR
jgi:hypothetical protein